MSDENFEQVFQVTGPARLEISNICGSVEIRPGADGVITVKAEKLVKGHSNGRAVAIGHVQVSSGYAADLRLIRSFCGERGIDLVVDCAQSLGCLPIDPEECHIAALAASGWKWLMGPWASGLLYTSAEFRRKLQPIMTGPGMMRQGLDYLDHRWNPYDDGRLFEYSTVAWDHAAGLNAVLEEVFRRYDGAAIRAEVFRLQDVFLAHCDPDLVRPLRFAEANRSGIVALDVGGEIGTIMARLAAAGVVMTGPAGYLRLAPLFKGLEVRAVAEGRPVAARAGLQPWLCGGAGRE